MWEQISSTRCSRWELMMMAAPSRARFRYRVLHAPDADGVQAGERLVKVDHPGRVEQAAGDGQLLFHAAGKLAGQGVPLAGDLQLFQQLVGDRLVVPHLVNPRDERQVLFHRQVIEQARLVGEEGQFPLRRDRILPEVMAANANAAPRRRDDARRDSARWWSCPRRWARPGPSLRRA